MNLFRILLICAAIWIIWRILRGVRVHISRIDPPKPDQYEAMARCRKCGVHLPASALSKSGLCGKCAE